MVGVDHEPTLNNKKEYDSAFMTFALHILALEGIGHIHKHLEKYWSIRKLDWLKNSTELENVDRFKFLNGKQLSFSHDGLL